MSRNEIRLRRHRMTSSGAERYRNYGEILQRHEQEVRIKRIIRVFTLFAVIMILVVLIVILVRIEKRSTPATSQATHTVQFDPPR